MYGDDPANGTQVMRRALGAGSVKDLAVFGDPGAQTVAATLDSGVYLWQPAAGAVTRLPDPAELDSSRVFKLCAFTFAGRRWLACAYTDGYLATWDLDNPAEAPTVQGGHDGPIWSLVASDDGGEPIVVSGGIGPVDAGMESEGRRGVAGP